MCSDAENYCRNPDADPKGPWCLVDDEGVEKEYCGVEYCSYGYAPLVIGKTQTPGTSSVLQNARSWSS